MNYAPTHSYTQSTLTHRSTPDTQLHTVNTDLCMGPPLTHSYIYRHMHGPTPDTQLHIANPNGLYWQNIYTIPMHVHIHTYIRTYIMDRQMHPRQRLIFILLAVIRMSWGTEAHLWVCLWVFPERFDLGEWLVQRQHFSFPSSCLPWCEPLCSPCFSHHYRTKLLKPGANIVFWLQQCKGAIPFITDLSIR